VDDRLERDHAELAIHWDHASRGISSGTTANVSLLFAAGVVAAIARLSFQSVIEKRAKEKEMSKSVPTIAGRQWLLAPVAERPSAPGSACARNFRFTFLRPIDIHAGEE
jgi:hypothetical protein